MITSTQFNYSYTAKSLDSLSSVKSFGADVVQLPQNTLLHYLGDDNGENGIRISNPNIAYKSDVYVHPIIELAQHSGNPRIINRNPSILTRSYLKDIKGRSIHLSLKESQLERASRNAAVVFDYSWLLTNYRYGPSKENEILRLDNVITTLFKNIEESEYENHIIAIKAPGDIGTLSELRAIPNTLPTSKYDDWNDINKYAILRIWRLLTDKKLKFNNNVYLSTASSSKLTLLNLTELLNWAEKDKRKVEQKFVLFFYNLMANDTEVETDALPDVEDDIIAPVTSSTKGLFEVKDDVIGKRGLSKQVDTLVANEQLSRAEQKRIEKLADSYKRITAPDGKSTLEEFTQVKKSDISLDSNKQTYRNRVGVHDKKMLTSTISNYHSQYVEKILEKDVAAAVLGIQNAGIIVKDYRVETKIDAANCYNEYSVELVPVRGKPSTLKFKLPVVDSEGEFIANGVRYRLGVQKCDIPLRKISGSKAACTSYYGKTFIQRDPKAVNNYSRWIVSRLSSVGIDSNDPRADNVIFTSRPVDKGTLPRHWTAISTAIGGFTTPKYTFYFNKAKESINFTETARKAADKLELTLCGTVNGSKSILAMDMIGDVWLLNDKGFKVEKLGPLPPLVSPDWTNYPEEFATIGIFGKLLPVGIALAYLTSLDSLLKQLKVKHRWVKNGARVTLEEYEARIRFRDESLIYSTKDKGSSLILSGFNGAKRFIKDYDAALFNQKNVYGELLSSMGMGRHILKELELMDELFIDPITLELLKDMGEPTEFQPLIKRASELLVTDESSEEMDSALMRIRGYERFSGFVYAQLINAVREQRNAMVPSRSQVSLRTNAVWDDVILDTSVTLVEESNPIHNLKEQESITFSGAGGRDAKTMVASTRIFHPNDIGLISEATPDSAKVGIRSYMTASPKLNSVRGTFDKFDFEKDGFVNACSTTAVLGAGSQHSDTKRVNLGQVQQSSTVACAGGQVLPMRTGYEQVIADRCSEKFASLSKVDGKVTSVTDKAVIITDKEGKEHKYQLGIYHGKAAGAVVPITKISDLNTGDKIKVGDAIAWSKDHFARDRFNKGGLTLKMGALATVVFKENSDTLEDGSAISPRLSKALETPTSKIKAVLVRFDQAINDYLKEGAETELDSILCTIEEASLSDLAGDDDALLGLKKLAKSAPKAKFKGKVTKITVHYQGNIDDMHPTLQTLTKADMKRRKEDAKYSTLPIATTGEIKQTTFIDGEKVTPNTMVISFHMDGNIDAGIGDKAVFDLMLKTIIGRIFEGRNVLEDGTEIDAIFSYVGIFNRIVTGVVTNGMSNMILKKLSKQVAEVYKNG